MFFNNENLLGNLQSQEMLLFQQNNFMIQVNKSLWDIKFQLLSFILLFFHRHVFSACLDERGEKEEFILMSSMIHSARPTVSPVVNIVFA